ncbi:hypothetical protein MHY1_03014 [Methylovirgula sp. HY1]|nr:hypothetical protein MHY1_03014 [Methylovirgula sp. HY1]
MLPCLSRSVRSGGIAGQRGPAVNLNQAMSDQAMSGASAIIFA